MHPLPIPGSDRAFEQLACDLLNQQDPSFNHWGRNGQVQSGFDIYSASKGIVAECKWKDINRRPATLYKEFKADVEKHISLVRNFSGFDIRTLILATTLKEDVNSLKMAAAASDDSFKIEIWGWQKIEEMLNNYPHLIEKYYPIFFLEPGSKKKFASRRSVSENHFSSSHGRIFLNAYLPCLTNGGKGSCAISFKCNELFMVTLVNTDIDDLETRREISIENCICGGQIKDVDNLWRVTLKSSLFYINEPDKNELCSILDDFLNEYRKAFLNYKRALGAEKFEVTGSGDIKLMTVSEELWNQMVRFSRDFDFDRGKSSWHIFNENGTSIIVQRPDSVLYNTWLIAQRSRSTLDRFIHHDEEIDIIWRVLHSQTSTNVAFGTRPQPAGG